jgi:hypothetical protein
MYFSTDIYLDLGLSKADIDIASGNGNTRERRIDYGQ